VRVSLETMLLSTDSERVLARLGVCVCVCVCVCERERERERERESARERERERERGQPQLQQETRRHKRVVSIQVKGTLKDRG
jgi:hypothetical protein